MSKTSKSGLSKALSTPEMLILGLGAMIGWGWIILTGTWVNDAGAMGAIAAFVLGTVLVSVIAVVYGELASAMPFVGGEHAYSLRALGPVGSFVCTWAIIFGYVTVVAFEAVALPSAFSYLIPGFNTLPLWTVAGETVYGSWILVGLLGMLLVTYLNYRGIRFAAQFQIVLTVVIALAGIVLLIGGVTNGEPSPDPAFIGGAAGVFSVVLAIPFMFVGFDVIPQLAEEADMSPRMVGRIITVAVLLAAVFYIAVIWGAGRALPGAALAESPLPAAAALSALYDSVLVGRIMALAGIAGILTSWNAMVIGASRAMFALADSGMLPESLSSLHPEYNTPTKAILLVGGISGLAPFFGEGMLNWAVNAGGLGIVVAWFLVTVSFLLLRYREPAMERPYKVPAGKAVGVFALVLSAFFVYLYLPTGASALVWPYEWAIVFMWGVLGVILYAVSTGESRDTAEDISDL
jgi:basic amino acid/polyamine antiporter, APA family